VAQVHFAELPDGTSVAVKVLRPNIALVIEKDLSLMQAGAMLVEKLWSDGKRLRPRDVVAEFEKTIRDELDLSREAANCSQLRRNFLNSPLLLVPAVHWDYCGSEVMVMERMRGIPIAQVTGCARPAWTSMTARAGVGSSSQVFRDGYFHADAHPAISSSPSRPHSGKYIAVDFDHDPLRARPYSSTELPAFFVATTTGRDRASSPDGCHRTRG
jgi:ubiquinone biosynthesis protein